MAIASRSLKRIAEVLFIACSTTFICSHAIAHIVMGGSSLRLLTTQSEVVARVRIIDATAQLDAVYDNKSFRTFYVVAQPLETWKGSLPEQTELLHFYQHGHGTAEYTHGEEALVFLQHTANIAELADGPIASQLEWTSEQAADAHFQLDDSNRNGYAEAVKSYEALARLPESQRADALRQLTGKMLLSPHPELAQSAMRDLVLAGEQIPLNNDDMTVLLPLIEGKQEGTAMPIGIRIGLLAELEKRKLLSGPPQWVQLIENTSGRDRVAVIRATAAHPSDAVVEALIPLLDNDDLQIASTAAVALGNQGSPAATAALIDLLQAERPQLRMSAIRGLGRDASPAAIEALKSAAADHADSATRRRALAELRALKISPQEKT